MSKIIVKPQNMLQEADELNNIADKLVKIHADVNQVARRLDISQNSLRNIKNSIGKIEIEKSAYRFRNFGNVTKECHDIFMNNEQTLISDEDIDIKEAIGNRVGIIGVNSDVAEWLSNTFKTGKNLVNLFDLDGKTGLSKFFNNSDIAGVFKYFNKLQKDYDTGMKFMKGDWVGGVSDLMKKAEDEIPKLIGKALGTNISGFKAKMCWNFGKSIGDNALEHVGVFSDGKGNVLSDLADFTWGITGEALYDFGMKEGLGIVEKGAAVFGIDYSQVLIDLTGKDGIEGVNLMMEQAVTELFGGYFEGGDAKSIIDGTVKITSEVCSFWGDVVGDFTSSVGKSIGGIFKW